MKITIETNSPEIIKAVSNAVLRGRNKAVECRLHIQVEWPNEENRFMPYIAPLLKLSELIKKGKR